MKILLHMPHVSLKVPKHFYKGLLIPKTVFNKYNLEMSDLGRLTYFLGMEFTEDAEGLVMHQRKYASDILKRFNMSDCNPSSSPAETNVKLVMIPIGIK